jgi:hypothetical protein
MLALGIDVDTRTGTEEFFRRASRNCGKYVICCRVAYLCLAKCFNSTVSNPSFYALPSPVFSSTCAATCGHSRARVPLLPHARVSSACPKPTRQLVTRDAHFVQFTRCYTWDCPDVLFAFADNASRRSVWDISLTEQPLCVSWDQYWITQRSLRKEVRG